MKKATLLLILFLALALTFSCAKKPPPGALTEEEPIVIEEEEEGVITEEPAETTAVETTAVETTAVAETTATVTPPPPPAPTTVYRIQIGAFYSASGANKRKARAASLLDRPIYVEYIAPYYKVRVGDFTTRGEAESYKSVVTHYFNDAFVTEATKSP